MSNWRLTRTDILLVLFVLLAIAFLVWVSVRIFLPSIQANSCGFGCPINPNLIPHSAPPTPLPTSPAYTPIPVATPSTPPPTTPPPLATP